MVSVALGGEWKALHEDAARSRALLYQADSALSQAEAQIRQEQERSKEVSSALGRVGQVAAAALDDLDQAQTSASRLSLEANTQQSSCVSLQCALAIADDELSQATDQLAQVSLELEAERLAHAEERRRHDAESAAHAATTEALQLQRQVNEDLRQDVADHTSRARRAVQARQEKERQLVVLSQEKQRLTTLLSKRDAVARQLQFVLKQRHEPETAGQDDGSGGAKPMGRGVGSQAITRPAGSASPSSPRTAVDASEAGGAAATRHTKPARTPSTSGPCAVDLEMDSPGPRRGGSWPTQHEAYVSPAVPSAQQRFRGWREANQQQRLSALCNENSILLAVVSDRDAALQAAEVEQRKLKQQNAILLAKWRGARRHSPTTTIMSRKRQEPLPGSPTPASPAERESPA